MERESKLIFRDDSLSEQIFGILTGGVQIGGLKGGNPESFEIHDEYLDTEDLSLEQQHVVCRKRSDPAGERVELKWCTQAAGNLSIYKTEKLNPPLSAFPDDKALKAFIRRSIPLTEFSDKPILPILRVTTSRTKVPFASQDGRVGVVLHLDKVHYTWPGDGSPAGELYEMEVKSDAENVYLDPFCERLRNLFGLIPIRRSKLSRCSRLIRHVNSLRRTGPRKVILDMDPGVDDALALLLALRSPEVEVLAITTVSGNVDARSCARNAAYVVDFLFANLAQAHSAPDIFVGGSPRRTLPDAADVHGPDGLGGVTKNWRPSAQFLGSGSAVEAMRELFDRFPGEITLIATGPLTNVARLAQNHPGSLRKVCEVVAMGGVFFEAGNRSQAAEFNIHSDPRSAKAVLDFCRDNAKWDGSSPFISLTFVGLDVTHQVCLRKEWIDRLSEHENRVALFVKEFSHVYMTFYRDNEGLNGCYIHDPLAVAWVIDPTLCETERYHVEIEAEGKVTSGMTVADYRPTRLFRTPSKEVTTVCVKVDSKSFERLFVERVFGSDACSVLRMD